MLNASKMLKHKNAKLRSAVFITFSGNCKKALTFYQTCFGGSLQFETFEEELQGFMEKPVVSGTLASERIILHASDLVHNEGRKIGNYISIFLPCKNISDRKELMEKLKLYNGGLSVKDDELKLIEGMDAFDVRWVLGV